MRSNSITTISCVIGTVFSLAIAGLHISGFNDFTAQMTDSDASSFLKSMFPILYAMPSLYLLLVSAFGFLAVFKPSARRAICFVLAVAVLACGALALIIGEWIPVVIMGMGALTFLVAAITAKPGTQTA